MNVLARRRERIERPGAESTRPVEPLATSRPAPGCVPIAEVAWRHRARVTGRVRSMRVQPWGGVPTLECTVVDESGGLIVVFLGRRAVAGVNPGRRMTVEGMVGDHHGHLAILNPVYELLA